MKVALGALAVSGIEDHFGADLPAGVRAALLHYVAKMGTGRGSLDVPRFFPEQAFYEPKVLVELEVDEEVEARLMAEAARQGATIDQVAMHSVLVYLAELDFLAHPTIADGPVLPC